MCQGGQMVETSLYKTEGDTSRVTNIHIDYNTEQTHEKI